MPVIVVGNVFVGGTGKTPVVMWLVEALRQQGYVPGVISRGFGGRGNDPRLVNPESAPRDHGDEPVLIAARTYCPVVVSADRVGAATVLLKTHPEVNLIISDDGLQHYALARDIEILLFDARGYGNGWLLPAGPLREPVTRRRDFTVVNAEPFPDGMPDDAIRMQLVGTHAEQLRNRTQARPLAGLATTGTGRDIRIIAAAGIGHPARFFQMLRTAGLAIDEMPLPDHYDFAANPFAEVHADIILITEKDAVKCSRIDILRNDPRIWVVPVTAQIDRALVQHIVEKLHGYPTA